MLRKFRSRLVISLVAMIVVFAITTIQLGNLTLAQNDDITTRSEQRAIRKITLKGTRGQITDINGIPLAYDQTSYNVEFTRDPSRNTTTDRAYYTDILIRTVKIIEDNGGQVIDSFNINRDENGVFSFDFGVKNPEAAASREQNWRENMYVNKKLTADAVYRDLRLRYRIPEEYTYEQARPLLSIWQESQLSSYLAYVPLVIAKDVSMETVAIIESQIAELDGIGIAESTVRIYPKDDVAAHIIGYLGQIPSDDESQLKDLQQQGYSKDDRIGVTGIESTQEAYLTGNIKERQGTREVEVNNRGKVIQELSYTPSTAGNNVMLTIDLGMQMELEKALENNVKKVYQTQLDTYYEKPQEYDNKKSLQAREGEKTLDKINLAKSGAAVVMDVNTGDILAMASYPSYDLNLFEGGISTADFEMLSKDKAAPLFNKAIASKGIPGSIFKMVTGMAGLMEGAIDKNSVIDDEGPFKKDVQDTYIGEGGATPSCWAYPNSYHDHQDGQTITTALSRSCNYFFFEVATMVEIDKVVEWSDKFGLMSKTNVELVGEQTGQIGNQTVLYDPEKSIDDQKTSHPKMVRDQIVSYLSGYGAKRNVQYDKNLLTETANELVALVSEGKYSLGPEIRDILSEKLDIPGTITKREGWDSEINQSLTQLMWNAVRTAQTGIGTDITAVTPIAVARYISALVNGGNVYDAHIVDSVIDANGTVVLDKEPEVWATIDAPQEYFDLIKEGMKSVVSEEDGGTASKNFVDWKYKDVIGGKTGTGKVSREIDLENNAWFVAFAPYVEPEIAVVVYIPNGLGGNHAIDTTKDIIEYYLDGKLEQVDTSIPASNTILQERILETEDPETLSDDDAEQADDNEET